MNYWTQLSYDFANQKDYLDQLFLVYPTIPDGIRDVNAELWDKVEAAFNRKDNFALIETLLKFKLFPIKDSYVAYLKRDKNSIQRNPQTVNRLCGRLYEMGLSRIYQSCSEPKETNRQMGSRFKNWIMKGSLGIMPVDEQRFLASNDNAILSGSDSDMKKFAVQHLNYRGRKGLDFIARFNGKFVVGEAKFLTDFGGHQNAQYNDAIATLNTEVDALKIAILDGVLYIPGQRRASMGINDDRNILSALVLRNFLYQI